MKFSQKCSYGLLAVYELAASGGGSRTIAEIAQAQAIPAVFLQNILRELRHAGLAESRRGKEGGYLLARPPHSITLGDVIRAMDGEIAPVEAMPSAPALEEGLRGISCSINALYEQVTLADVLMRAQFHQNQNLDFSI